MPGKGWPIEPGLAAAPDAVVTTGDASVRPYPSAIVTPKRRSHCSATSSDSLDAPDAARRTVAKASRVASGEPAHAVHIAGAPGTIVTPWLRMASTADAGSKRSTSTTDEPA